MDSSPAQQQKTQQRAIDFLPADQKDLSKSEYWKKFFEFDKFKDGFEWYASFDDLRDYLKQNIKDKQDGSAVNVVVPGCGNSDLSEKICKELALSNVVVDSFDYEEQVVKNMEENKPKDIALTYRFGDGTNLKDVYKDGQFDVAVDKGTFDALAVDDSEETVTRCWAYFNEMVRVLANDGVLVIVSLLQPHVLKIFMDFFVKDNEKNLYQQNNIFNIKFQKILQIEGYAEKQFIKYYVSVKKSYIDTEKPAMVNMRKELQDRVSLRDGLNDQEVYLNREMATEKIKIDQQVYMIAPTLQELQPGKQVEMHCFDFQSEENRNVPKYTLHVVDSTDKNDLRQAKCICIITPQGRETDSSFCTQRGRQDLCLQTKSARAIVIFLGHGHTFGQLKDITSELSPKILELAPKNCSNKDQIPFMTAGNDIGQKHVIDVAGNDKIGGLIVQDIRSEDLPKGVSYRQVIFEDKVDQIQSEIQMVYRDPKKHDIPPNMLANSKLCPKKKGKVAVLNHDSLTCDYQSVMLAGIFQVPKLKEVQKLRILHLGTGAGTFPMFLKSQLTPLGFLEKLVTIDLNEDILTVGKNYFGFDPDGEILESVVGDAYDYVLNSQNGGGEPYHMLFMDLNYSADDVNISPPKKFLEVSFLRSLCNMVHASCGYICINVQIYDDDSMKELLADLAELKDGTAQVISYHEVDNARNCIVMLARNEQEEERRDDRLNSEKLTDVIRGWKIQNKNLWLKELDMEDCANKINNFVNVKNKGGKSKNQ